MKVLKEGYKVEQLSSQIQQITALSPYADLLVIMTYCYWLGTNTLLNQKTRRSQVNFYKAKPTAVFLFWEEKEQNHLNV